MPPRLAHFHFKPVERKKHEKQQDFPALEPEKSSQDAENIQFLVDLFNFEEKVIEEEYFKTRNVETTVESLLQMTEALDASEYSDIELFQEFCSGNQPPLEFLVEKYPSVESLLIETRLATENVFECIQFLNQLPKSKIETQVLYIQHSFPWLSRDILVAKLKQFQYNCQSTLNHLLNTGPLDLLLLIFPNHSIDFLMNALNSTESIEQAIAICQKQPVKLVLSGSRSSFNHSLSEIQTSNALIVDASSSHYRSKASEAASKRHELFSRAAAEFKRGQLFKGAAAFYSQQGHELTREMDQFNKQAAAAVIQENKHSEPNVIDLHGLTVKEAVEYANSFVQEWFSRPRSIRKVQVITGLGTHSRFGQSKLLPAVSSSLKRAGYKVEQENSNRGVFTVSLLQ